MAQQTRVATVVPYYNRWIEALPSPTAVAQAHEDKLLKLWEGLGYYRRVLNLHQAAKLMVERHAGRVPGTKAELLALPGIGRYSAGGILSLAFNQPEPAIDGNVVRLFSRLHDTIYSTHRRADVDTIDVHIRQFLDAYPTVSPGLVAEGLMALGSKVCKPTKPDCCRCPVQSICATFASDSPIPKSKPNARKPVPVRRHVGFILLTCFEDQNRVLLVRNKRQNLLGGLWGFPAVAQAEFAQAELSSAAQFGRELFGITLKQVDQLAPERQDYSHFQRLQETFVFTCSFDTPELLRWEEGKWIALTDIHSFALSRIDQKIASQLLRMDTLELA